MCYSLVHQDKGKQTRSLQFGTKYGTTATIAIVGYAMAHAMCRDKKCPCRADQCNKTAHRAQNSSERSIWQSAQDLHTPHWTVCMVLHPADYTNCYEHTELFQWQRSLLRQALQSSLYSHITIQCVCLERWVEPILNYLTVTSAHYTTPGNLLQTSNPTATCPPHIPTIHRDIMFQQLRTNWKSATYAAMNDLQKCTLQCVCECSTCHKTCTWQRTPNENTNKTNIYSVKQYIRS